MSGSRETFNKRTGLARGSGWVEKTRAGRYQARLCKGQKPIGTFDTKDEAIQALTKGAGVSFESDLTVSVFLDEFLQLKASRLGVRTHKNYRWYAKRRSFHSWPRYRSTDSTNG